MNNCTSEWTTLNGVNGIKFTSEKNGNSIFLPAAGYRDGDSLRDAGSDGGYWSSSLYPYYTPSAHLVSFVSNHVGMVRPARYSGRSVRPVSD